MKAFLIIFSVLLLAGCVKQLPEKMPQQQEIKPNKQIEQAPQQTQPGEPTEGQIPEQASEQDQEHTTEESVQQPDEEESVPPSEGNEANHEDESASPEEIPDEITPFYLEQHGSPDDCWMVKGTDVYDLTDYIAESGKDITEGCGKDATALFGMWNDAMLNEALAEYWIGEFHDRE
jgi:cytochrome b involved in lipid metabolism